MESKITRKARAQIEQVKAEVKRIASAQQKMTLNGHEAQRKLELLKGELSGLITAWGLGEISDSEIADCKRQVGKLESFIEDSVTALKGLEEMEKAAQIKMREPRRLLRKVDDYQRLRKELDDGGPVSGVNTLRSLAGVLGFEVDCESFVAGLPQMRS